MSIRNLDKLFRPKHVALLGACNEDNALGAIVLRNLLAAGFQGIIYPVNAACESVRGIHSYHHLSDLPSVPELAVICTPPTQVADSVRACGHAGVAAVLIISHFTPATPADSIAALSAEFPHLRILGPGSLGIINPRIGLNASFTIAPPVPGHLALICQSAALANAILDRANEKGIGLSYFIAMGNISDISFGDLIDYFALDPQTRAIILYLQSVDSPRVFMSAARACARLKPIVAYKAGRFAESAQAAASHTGAMVAEDSVYEAAFQRAGIVRVLELDDIFDVAELLARQRLPQGERLAIISNSGGAAVVAADALLMQKGRLAVFSAATLARLQTALPGCAPSNPLDLGDEASAEAFAEAVRILTADNGTDAVLVLFTPQVNARSNKTARLLGEAAKGPKPVLAAWMGGQSVRKAIRLLNEAGLPTHATPEHAVRAFMNLVSYARNLEILYETPRDIPLNFELNRRKLHDKLNPLLYREEMLSTLQAKSLLQAYEIPVCETRLAGSAQEAVKIALAYPIPAVALKAVTVPQIIHKTDINAVALNLRSPEQIRQAYAHIAAAVYAQRPEVEFKGVLVQPMERVREGLELILGAKKDATFGTVIMVGVGGFTTGIYQDRAVGLPPLNERLARHMLESLQAWPLFNAYRGKPAVNLDLLIETMMRFSYLVADYPEFREIDINPLLVTPTKVIALDVVILLDNALAQNKPYHHLAIRPYPEEYVRRAKLKDGLAVTLRPIRPEDEPLWQSLLSTSSPESIRFRFRSLFKHITHEMATRHCYIDYEREISIVGEIEQNGERTLIGVGSLSAESDETSAEFAVLVSDAWQGKGLGGMLLDYCLEIAGHWGVKTIIAETDPHNHKMLESFAKRGFIARRDFEAEVVYLHKLLF
jgi:acetyltransferase